MKNHNEKNRDFGTLRPARHLILIPRCLPPVNVSSRCSAGPLDLLAIVLSLAAALYNEFTS